MTEIGGEPDIRINGVKLTTAQAMTVRVALGSFAPSLRSGLGDDEHGRAMTRGYQGALDEVLKLMARPWGTSP